VPILIGLAIDYGVHLISRFEEELRRGHTREEAITTAIAYTGQGILTGALTTGGAFLAMTLTNFRGIQEMGIICGGGLLLCFIPMMTTLPALLLMGRRKAPQPQKTPEARARLENIWLRRPALVTTLTFGVCALAATQIPKVYFDYNLMHMQSAGLPAVQVEKELLDADKSLLFGAVIAENQRDAAAMLARLTNLPAVASIDSAVSLLSEDQTAKLQLAREIKSELASVSFGAPDVQPVNLAELGQTLYALGGYLGAANSEVQKEDSSLAAQFSSLRQAVARLHREMLQGTAVDREKNSLKLAGFQRALFGNIVETFHALRSQDTDSLLQPRDLPAVIRHRFIGVTGKYLLMVYPKRDLRERVNQEEFIQQVQTVYPSVCGAPVQLYYYTEQLKRSYEVAAGYSLIAIIILILFHFRSLVCVIFALIPVVVGSVWLLGIMGFFNIPFNPANIMILPLVIGIGVTNGIQILNRYAEDQSPGILVRSTGKAVLVSGLTSIVGFGSLMVGKHQGIQSLGYVMSCGLAACMLSALTFLPVLWAMITHWRAAQPAPAAEGLTASAERKKRPVHASAH
jgi:predicted RND superfamily exporter protein